MLRIFPHTNKSVTSVVRSNKAISRALFSAVRHQENQGGNQQSGGNTQKLGAALAVGGGLLAAAFLEDNHVKAESKNSALGKASSITEILDQENRVRQYGTTETIFDYFSSFQTINSKGKKMTLMSVSDFYNAVTPGSTLTNGTGRGVYTIVTNEEIHSKELYGMEKIPNERGESLLNNIQAEGLLTYMDFIFLTHILATPRRYMDIAFHAFDVSADGDIEAKEFIHVMSTIINHKGNPEELLEENHSGLINFLFGRDKKKSIHRADFNTLQSNLQEDMLYLEFCRYDKENSGLISEVDFCKHILYSANIPNKKKEKMIKRVEKAFRKSGGISFDVFRDFYRLLFGGSDLERAMFFLDTDSEKDGVNRDEFSGIAKWVAGKEIDSHVIDVVFTLLDEDGDKNLTVKEFVPVMFQWRDSRGFQKSSVQVSLGQLKI